MRNAEEAFAEAERRIAKALAKGRPSLDLSIEGLGQLPQTLADLTWLEKLYVRKVIYIECFFIGKAKEIIYIIRCKQMSIEPPSHFAQSPRLMQIVCYS